MSFRVIFLYPSYIFLLQSSRAKNEGACEWWDYGLPQMYSFSAHCCLYFLAVSFLHLIFCFLYCAQNWRNHRSPRLYVYFLHCAGNLQFHEREFTFPNPYKCIYLINVNQPNFPINCHDCYNICSDGGIMLAFTKKRFLSQEGLMVDHYFPPRRAKVDRSQSLFYFLPQESHSQAGSTRFNP